MSLPGSEAIFGKPGKIRIIVQKSARPEMFLHPGRKRKIMPFRVVWRREQVAGMRVERSRRPNADCRNFPIVWQDILDHLEEALQPTGFRSKCGNFLLLKRGDLVLRIGSGAHLRTADINGNNDGHIGNYTVTNFRGFSGSRYTLNRQRYN